jgi:hypothetical protein
MLMTEKTKRATANGLGAPQQKGDTAMATTSSTLTAGTAITGQGGNGIQKRAAGVLAAATLGLGLLAGGLLGHGRQAVTPSTDLSGATASHISVALGDRDDPRFAGGGTDAADQFIYREDHSSAAAPAGARAWTGACRAGGSDCLPGDDDVAPALPRALPHGWVGSCRPGGSDCVPDEDLLPVGLAQGLVPDQFTYREDHRGER